MRVPLRSLIVTAALVAVCGCATKSAQSEPTPAVEPQPPARAPAVVTPPSAPAPAVAPPPPAPSTASQQPPARAQTGDERQAARDKRLHDSLDSFDAQLRKEQQKIAQERDARQTAIATASSDSTTDGNASGTAGTEGSGGQEKRTASSNKRGPVRAERPGDLKSDKSTGANSSVAIGNGAVAVETPDGNDDDIVARRLRKAAEQETDPELKDRLWKEYVEYKKNTQVK